MKGTLPFDPADYDYGPATAAVRQIFMEWADVDWFAPPRADGVALFEEHQSRAHAHAPDLFSKNPVIQTVRGGWTEFEALCARVRTGEYDWKFSGLKPLSSAHSKAHGWSLQQQRGSPLENGKPRPGDLFVRLGETVFITAPISLKLDLEHHVAIGGWYKTYADADAWDCIVWQLAKQNDSLDDNPFLPLLRVYAAGFCPFVVARDEVLLFAFAREDLTRWRML